MDGTGEHDSQRGQPDSEDQKSYVLPHMWTLDLRQISNVVGLGLHVKGRTYTGGMGLDRKSKT
jgi:hypothetical protein